MKISIIKTLAGLFSIALIFSFQALQAQSMNVWLGNTFGSNDWSIPSNWSQGHVPHDMEVVIIPDLSAKGKACYPLIRMDAVAERLQLAPNARLSIETGATLTIGQVMPAEAEFLSRIDNQGQIWIASQGISEQALKLLCMQGQVGIK